MISSWRTAVGLLLPGIALTALSWVPPRERANRGVGALRSAAADLCWLRVYAAWERQDPVALRRRLRETVAADPDVMLFWLHGARMLAFDVPRWGIPTRAASQSLGAEALQWLERAHLHHPTAAAIWVEIANIHLYARDDVEAAAEAYRRAAECADPPHYAARIYAELLERSGRVREAYAWLCRVHQRVVTLPSSEWESAMPEVVLNRIRRLEIELSLPASEQYSPLLAP